jgi:hypothetical protein
MENFRDNKEVKSDYRSIYNDVANMRILSKEQLSDLNKDELLKLILAYNDILTSIYEAKLL